MTVGAETDVTAQLIVIAVTESATGIAPYTEFKTGIKSPHVGA